MYVRAREFTKLQKLEYGKLKLSPCEVRHLLLLLEYIDVICTYL
jgi:hypothetical protein